MQRLLLDEGGLERVGAFASTEALEGHDLGIRRYRGDPSLTGAYGLAVDQYCAGPALSEAAAEFGATELEIVAENVEEGVFGGASIW